MSEINWKLTYISHASTNERLDCLPKRRHCFISKHIVTSWIIRKARSKPSQFLPFRSSCLSFVHACVTNPFKFQSRILHHLASPARNAHWIAVSRGAGDVVAEVSRLTNGNVDGKIVDTWRIDSSIQREQCAREHRWAVRSRIWNVDDMGNVVRDIGLVWGRISISV